MLSLESLDAVAPRRRCEAHEPGAAEIRNPSIGSRLGPDLGWPSIQTTVHEPGVRCHGPVASRGWAIVKLVARRTVRWDTCDYDVRSRCRRHVTVVNAENS